MSKQRYNPPRQEDKAFIKAVEDMDVDRCRDFGHVFNDFLDLSLSVFAGNIDQRQSELLNKWMKDELLRTLFLTAFKRYGEAAEGYHDPLGDAFMARISFGDHGQFFTPDEICEMLAVCTVDKDSNSMMDCCCGSGRLLLAGLKQAREKGRNPKIWANDIALTCSKMTLLNLLSESARGLVTCGDALINDMENFTYFHMDNIRCDDGKLMSVYWQYSAEDYEEVNQKRNEFFNYTRNDELSVVAEVSEDEPKEVKAMNKLVLKNPKQLSLW